ncbi:hypothetical protein HYU92_01765 [Candidatus Curtissbacteria bacterium]|nr:hypothetical protein [Candidatus Curtissbacteria bacterium]
MRLRYSLTIDKLQLTTDIRKLNFGQLLNVKCQMFVPGQTLIEVVVAMAIVVLLGISIISINLVTQKSARSARNNVQATNLASQNIEQMRVFRDRKGFSALTDATCYYLANAYTNPDPNTWSLTACSGPPYEGESISLNNTTFRRKIDISTVVAGKKQVRVTVVWQDSGGAQSVLATTFLTLWCPGPVIPGSPCPAP